MLDFYSYRELRNGKRYKTIAGHKMSENGSTEGSKAGILWESTEKGVPESLTLTQEVVNE